MDMGFKVQRKTYKLRFQGTDLDGLVVVARGLKTGQLIELETARLERDEGGEKSEGATSRMLTLLAGALVEWNAEDEDDKPIPATLAGLLEQDIDFCMAIINAWQEAMVGVRGPLSQTSSDGQPSALEASIPMDVPSESLAS